MTWHPSETILAMAHDIPIPGNSTQHCNCLRLWRAKPISEFDLELFNEGEYYKAIEDQMKAELITSVLDYSDVGEGKQEYRLKQEYFLCAASVRDICEHYKFANRKEKSPSEESQSSSLTDKSESPREGIEESKEAVYGDVASKIDWTGFATENQLAINDT